eukprot:SM000137S00483  [mRNA]  locus=s137:393002:395418:- [translate_table: standard]
MQVDAELRGNAGNEGDFVGGANGSGYLEKSDRTPVTVADFGVQALIALELEHDFPELRLVGEEDARQLRAKSVAAPVMSTSGSRSNSASASGEEKSPLVERVRRAVAEHVRVELREITPDSLLAAIDRGGTKEHAASYWVLDPIDGTRGFLRGGDSQYVIGLALVEDGAAIVGVLGCPNMMVDEHGRPCPRATSAGASSGPASPASSAGGCIIWASLGDGTWAEPLQFPGVADEGEGEDRAGARKSEALRHRLHVDIKASLRAAVFCISDHETWSELPLARTMATESVDGGGPAAWEALQLPICCGSLCKYAAVSCGAASIFVQHPLESPELKVWDHAAGVICVTEAGGQVTDFEGDALCFGRGGHTFHAGGGGVVVTNGSLHAEVLEKLRTSMAAGTGPTASLSDATM